MVLVLVSFLGNFVGNFVVVVVVLVLDDFRQSSKRNFGQILV